MNPIKPNVVSVSRFGDVTFEPDINKTDKVKDVWITYSDGSNVRLEQGVQYTIGPDNDIRFKFQPSDFKLLIDSPVNGVMVEYKVDGGHKEKYQMYDSPWYRHNQPIPTPTPSRKN